MNKEQLKHIRGCKEIYKKGKSNKTRLTGDLKSYQLFLRDLLNDCIGCCHWKVNDCCLKFEEECDKL